MATDGHFSTISHRKRSELGEKWRLKRDGEMGKTLVEKIVASHLVAGTFAAAEWPLLIDQTLTQDATGTMAYLQFEALGLSRPLTELSVSYVDHNISESGRQAVEFLESFADRYGIIFSPAGNGICHQVHLERFAKPGRTLLGSDSHTPTCGGMGCLAIGAGGLDIAAAMARQPFVLSRQRIVGVKLSGRLQPWVAAKDVILQLLRRLTVKGGVGCIFEYFGPGLASLSVPERATISNMGAELGATTSIFPADEMTRAYLAAQGREADYQPLAADSAAHYDELLEIDLDQLEPLLACPSSPDNVRPLSELLGTPVAQVIIGSCTNSSYKDLAVAAAVLAQHEIHPTVEFHLNPGSRQVLATLEVEGWLAALQRSSIKINPAGCLGCIGMAQEPPPGKVSLRTFNRNFKGRSGTAEDQVYLCSPEIALAAAIKGVISDPRELGAYPALDYPKAFSNPREGLLWPSAKREVLRGELIAPLPLKGPAPEELDGQVLLKTGDNITTDDIMPAGRKIIPLRSHIPRISAYVFHYLDPDFARRAKELGGGFIVGGENYGQGSSREHAALAPMYLGVKAVLAKSFARIHRSNLINFGILPLQFERAEDYESLSIGAELHLPDLREWLHGEQDTVAVENRSRRETFSMCCELSRRQRELLLAGGLLSYIKERLAQAG